jgi:hypothetical protein
MKNSRSDARAFAAAAGFSSFLAFMLLSGFGSIEGLLAPGKNLWPRWTVNDSASTVHIDYAAWSAFLQKYLVVGEINRLHYARVTADDRRRPHSSGHPAGYRAITRSDLKTVPSQCDVAFFHVPERRVIVLRC